MEFGESVRRKLEEKDITQNELAKMIGMSSSGISTALGRDGNPRIDTIVRIAAALGCTVAELLGEGAPAAAPSDGLTPTERQLIRDFRQLNDQGVQYVLQSMAMALALSKSQGHGLADVALSG